MDWQKTSASDATGKGLISKIYKQLIQLSKKRKKKKKTIKKWAEDLHAFLQRRHIDGQRAHEKMLNTAKHH